MKDRFIEIFKSCIDRDGADELLAYLEKSSFFDDPASAKHHLDIRGGLCQHSVHVFERLLWLCEAEAERNIDFEMPSDETIAIVGLLHDLCKTGTYIQEPKNQKTYDPEKVAAAGYAQKKHDSHGDFVWETILAYKNDDKMPYGHGEKSVYIISSFMRLTREEAFAIRYHMGSWNDGEKNNASKAFEMYPLAFLVHVADEWATFVDEKAEEN